MDLVADLNSTSTSQELTVDMVEVEGSLLTGSKEEFTMELNI